MPSGDFAGVEEVLEKFFGGSGEVGDGVDDSIAGGGKLSGLNFESITAGSKEISIFDGF